MGRKKLPSDEKKSSALGIRLDPVDRRALERLARVWRCSLSWAVTRILRERLHAERILVDASTEFPPPSLLAPPVAHPLETPEPAPVSSPVATSSENLPSRVPASPVARPSRKPR